MKRGNQHRWFAATLLALPIVASCISIALTKRQSNLDRASSSPLRVATRTPPFVCSIKEPMPTPRIDPGSL